MREDEASLGKITKPRRPRTVVLCPTRELSEQVAFLFVSFVVVKKETFDYLCSIVFIL